jgi:thiol peroxidase
MTLSIIVAGLSLAGCVLADAKEKNMAEERTVAMKGKPFQLAGNEVKIDDKAPDCDLIANDLSKVKLSSFCGKVCVLVSVPSLDTTVCDVEARRFNEEAAKLGPDAQVVVVSMDLPFAQKRWCGAAGIENVVTLSDHRQAEFGEKYGVLIDKLRLLARAVFVIDQGGVVQYVQIVPELTNEPDYDEVLDAVKKILK